MCSQRELFLPEFNSDSSTKIAAYTYSLLNLFRDVYLSISVTKESLRVAFKTLEQNIKYSLKYMTKQYKKLNSKLMVECIYLNIAGPISEFNFEGLIFVGM